MLVNFTEMEKMGSLISRLVGKYIYRKQSLTKCKDSSPDTILIYPRPGEMCIILNGKFYSVPHDQVKFQTLAYRILAASLEDAMKEDPKEQLGKMIYSGAFMDNKKPSE